MLTSHIILAVLWVLYGVLHSLLAADGVKRLVQVWLGRRYKFYTFIYSVFAALSLVGVVLYQFSIPQVWLWVMPAWAKVVMIVPVLLGLYIMGALIRKYFFALSGISAFYKSESPVALELGGWNRYMRHPLYFGTLLFIWALFFLFPLLSNLIACVIITAYTLTGTILEEKKLVMQFGRDYVDYQRRVPMIIPSFRRS